MSIDRLLVLLNLLATTGVLGSVLLIVLQMQQSEELAFDARRNEAMATMSQIEAMVIGDDMAETLARIEADDGAVTDADRIKFAYFADYRFVEWQIDPDNLGEGDYMIDVVCYYFGHSTGRAYLAHLTDTWGNSESGSIYQRVKEAANNCDDSKDYLKYVKDFESDT